MSSFKEYIHLHDKYTAQYGDRTIVMMQMGSFYCMYAANDIGPDIKRVSQLLNVVLTRKNKKIKTVSVDNPAMVGVPTVSFEKYTQVLVNNSYTVVVVDQTSPPPRVKREVTAVHSPGTWLQNMQTDTQTMVMLYITQEKQRTEVYCKVIGMASIDLTTGHSCIHEAYDTIVDTTAAMDECMAFLAQHKPTETMVFFDAINDADTAWHQKTIEYMNITNITNIQLLTPSSDWFDAEFLKLSYQQEFLTKVFSKTPDPIEAFELEGTWKRNAWVLLLIRCYNQRRQIVDALKEPDHFQATGRMNLGSNVISALNVVASDTVDNNSLYKIINFTSTAMGRRYLKHCLLNPLSCIKQIQCRLDAIEALAPHWGDVEEYLKPIYDIVRLHRKMSLKMLAPHEFASLRDSYQNILDLLEFINKSTTLNIKSKTIIKKAKQFVAKYDVTFDHEAMAQQESQMIFNEGVVHALDGIVDQIHKKTSFMSNLASELSILVEDKKQFKKEGALEAVRMEQNNRDGHYLVTTKRRGKLLQKAFEQTASITVNNETIDVKELIFNSQQRSNDVIITLPDMNDRSDELTLLTDQLTTLIKDHYNDTCKEIYDEFHECFDKIVSIVSKIDFFKSGAKCAEKYRYCKPTLVGEQLSRGAESRDSYFAADQLRHPIVERINKNTQYVAHDISMGNDVENGILLYGLNSAGKSTIMKAIGLSIILAQAGLFVPARQFTIAPFDSLMTRITGNDDLFRGMSSFDLEMTEIKAILKRNSKNTIVIGDELCRGTESESGITIVATILEMLTATKSKFIFATHMHILNDIEAITSNKSIAMKHLTVDYCTKTNVMKFDRNLKSTSGPKNYGVNVARHIINDTHFTNITQKYEGLLGQAGLLGKASAANQPIVATKTSNYNKSLYMTECELCNHRPTEGMIPLETHHIVPQRLADKDGFLLTKPHIHKNTRSNLVVLCHKCHDCIDRNEVVITGFTETSNGNYLNVDVGKTNLQIKNKWINISETPQAQQLSEKPH